MFVRFDDRYDAEPFTYDEEELEPPPPDEREDAMDNEGQLNHGDESSALNQGRMNGAASQSQQVIASGDVQSAHTSSKAIPSEQRTTTPYMTKYERARILGTRALQIR